MRVLVTGANGHLGFNLVSALLAGGHAVRGSIRSLSDTNKIARLTALGNVEAVTAALDRPEQLRAAMADIDVLFHTAAVYAYTEPRRNAEILDTSIKGAETVLRAAAAAGVRKVVLTSSLVTLPLTVRGAPPVDESQWTDRLNVPYFRAKTEGEQMAWRTAKELGVDLITMLPGAIVGPGFARNTPTIDMIEAMMRGGMRMGVPDMNFPLVDVRDVAAAHVLAGEQDCDGRFVVCNDILPSLRTMLETMHSIDSRVPLPWMTLPDFMVGALPFFDRLNRLTLGTPATLSSELIATLKGKIWNPSNRRIKETLGWRPAVPMEQSLGDTMTAIRARGESGPKASIQPAVSGGA